MSKEDFEDEELKRRIRSAFYHVVHSQLTDPVQNVYPHGGAGLGMFYVGTINSGSYYCHLEQKESPSHFIPVDFCLNMSKIPLSQVNHWTLIKEDEVAND